MMIFWIKKVPKEDTCTEKEKRDGGFREHDDRMKKFRIAHPGVEPVKPGGTRAMQLLVPYRNVKLDKYISN